MGIPGNVKNERKKENYLAFYAYDECILTFEIRKSWS
jgi:hypothetical protein